MQRVSFVAVVLSILVLSFNTFGNEEQVSSAPPETPAAPSRVLLLNFGVQYSAADKISLTGHTEASGNISDIDSRQRTDAALSFILEGGLKRQNSLGLSIKFSYDLPRDDGRNAKFSSLVTSVDATYSIQRFVIFGGPNYTYMDYKPASLPQDTAFEVYGAIGHHYGVDYDLGDAFSLTLEWRRLNVKMKYESSAAKTRYNGQLDGFQLGLKYSL